VQGILHKRESTEWVNLALAALAGLYVLYSVWSFLTRGLFEYMGIDYRAILATAQIAYEHGFGSVYDLTLQARYQEPLFNLLRLGAIRPAFDPVPLPYLPVFIAALLPTIAVAPVPGFVVFVLIQAIGLGVYLSWYSKKVDPAGVNITMCVLSLPAFLTLLFGQVNLWLLICLGQAIFAESRRRDFWAGMWIAGMLLKPQVLILLVPALILTRRWRVIEGFSAGAGLVLAGSMLLAGPAGLLNLARLILSYPNNLPTTYPESMMNFRALGLLLGSKLPGGVTVAITALGMLVTVLLSAVPWRRVRFSGETGFAVALLGTYAATCAITWHAHIHMAMPMLAPVVFLMAKKLFPFRLLVAWTLIPGFVFAGVAFSLGPATAHLAAGQVMLVANLGLLAWSVWKAGTPTPRESQLDVQLS
jgi:hypothetical protein